MSKRHVLTFPVAVLSIFVISSRAQTQLEPSVAGQLDSEISAAVGAGLIPGAVLVVGSDQGIVYRKAFGLRAVVPEREPMTLDTIFDAASLTKVVVTTTCAMKLFEQGKLRLDDPVTRYLPEFQNGKSEITVRNLMTHFSGLRPDLDLRPRWTGYDTGIRKALVDKPTAPPGTRFVYSDINFLLVGEIVRRLSGKTMPEFAQAEFFSPLGMVDSQFQPPPSLRSRIAPTQVASQIEGDGSEPLRGIVHDPTARFMGGVAGNAGLFTTGDDLAKFAEMLLNGGQRHGTRVLNPQTIQKLIEPATPADQPILRGLGWDIDSPFSANRGELYPIGSFGHTGYTGTSIWLDPASRSYVILLTNVVHPNGVKSIASLRARVATLVASSRGITHAGITLTGYNETIGGAGIHRVVSRNANTVTGLDVLARDGFKPLLGKRVGLITNHTGVNRDGKRNVDLMLAVGVHVVALYSPEHGLLGSADEEVSNAKDADTGLPVISLFQPRQRRLSAAQMAGIDVIVFDIQDIGARFYTYSCTLLYAVEEAGKAGKPFFVLDRPNPITGTHVEGPLMDKALESFVGCYDIPVRHGMTLGELASMANAEQHWKTDLHVIRAENWERGDWFDSTSLVWVNPSPNMRSLNAALLYSGLALLEANKNYSVGRGTEAPFEQIGADWIDGSSLAQYLNSRFVPGVRVYATRFEPISSNFANKSISGVRFVVTDREAFDSTRLGLELAAGLQKLFPGHLDFQSCAALIGNQVVLNQLTQGADGNTIWAGMDTRLRLFLERRRKFLSY